MCECRGQVHQQVDKRREILCSPGIILLWVWDGPLAFSKEQINFPSFCRLFDGSNPELDYKSLGSSSSPMSSNNPVPERGREECSHPWQCNATIPCDVKLYLPGVANRLMLPSLLNSMSHSLCSPLLLIIH